MPFNALAVAVALLSKSVRGTPETCLIRSWIVFVAYQVWRVPQLALIARMPKDVLASTSEEDAP